jgi:hypothetical protein
MTGRPAPVQLHDETVNLRQFFDSARGTPLAMFASQEVNMKSRLIATRFIVPTLLALHVAGDQIREPEVARSSVWIDTVKRGDMVREVRGLGQLRGTTGSLTAVLKIAAAQTVEIKVGQAAQIDTRGALVAGIVAGVGPAPVDGMVDVEIKPSSALPDGAIAGTAVDSTVVIERLQNILHVGRPVVGGAGSTVELFRLEPGGDYAVRVPVSFGRSSVKVIEIREGLREGDKVILSDMSAWKTSTRIRLQ